MNNSARNFSELPDYGELSQSGSIERKELIELLCPEVRFLKVNGKHTGFGTSPEQAEGTINGRPFYFRFRYDTAFLSVWDRSFDGEPVQAHNSRILSALAAFRRNVTGNRFACSMEDTEADAELFISLVNNLEQTNPADRSLDKQWKDELTESLFTLLPGVTVMDYRNIQGLVVRLESGSHMAVSFYEDPQFPSLDLEAFVPGQLGRTGNSSWLSHPPIDVSNLNAQTIQETLAKGLEEIRDNRRTYETEVSRWELSQRKERQIQVAELGNEIRLLAGKEPLSHEEQRTIHELHKLDHWDIL